jgi:iron complex outermembrane receptor protein
MNTPRYKNTRRPHALAAACALAALGSALPGAQAQTANPGTTDAGSIVITGSPVQRLAADAPYAISVIDAQALQNAGPMINLSEALVQVPGLVVNNRSNYAQDLQISARGFGARAGFGVRGLRLYADGIPASGPDGQGQVSHFDIAGAQRVEVLRGPFSVLYGNSSGGVIAIFSAAPKAREWNAGFDAGSFGLRQVRVGVAAPLGQGFDLRVAASQMEIDGFRPQSAAQKGAAQARLGWRGERDNVTLVLNHLDQPADDPLGLAREQFVLGPQETAAVASQFDTRKNTRQTQAGASWQHRFDEGALRDSQVALYSGERRVAQWLAIPAATQNNPRHGGGVIAFDRRYEGADARLRWAWPAAGLDLVTGASVERQRDARKGYNNYTGTVANPVLGVTGTLRRDENNTAETRDLYAQGEWALSPALSATLGVRSGRVKLQAQDAFLANGNDSGQLEFSYTNPVLGLRWQASPGLNLYASLARGFESPTLGELAYRVDGTGGFNTALQPQTSRQAEIGAKWRSGGLQLDATLFQVETNNEIGVATNAGGRSAFQNVGRTQRRGAELGLGWRITPAWRTQLAVGVLEANYRDSFLVCAGIPCNAPTLAVPAGGRIAGAPRGNAFAEVVWTDEAWGEWGLEARALGRVAVNDRNTDAAAGYALGALRWSKTYAVGGGMRMGWLLRVDNVFDHAHAGSVIVNDANGRFFEPGAPRAVLLALRLTGGF